MNDPRRRLPSVGTLLDGDAARPFLKRAPRTLVADAVRDAVDLARRDPGTAPRDEHEWRDAIGAALAARELPSLRRLHNATGVVLHTNLGRAPLALAAMEAVARTAGYVNLEYDLDRGARGSRYVHCVTLLRELTGAEDALVVNNGAAALLLALATFGADRETVISRGELIEIGGSFRVPDIMERSGTRLVEVGTTNRTHAADYQEALSPRTGALVKVHRSNFSVAGFVAEVSARELAELGAARDLPTIFDLGSGLLIPLDRFGLTGEPLVREAVGSGVSVVTMSGDKLLGGPQAGIILGRGDAIGRMARNPLTRALRVDKLTLSALEATLALYREPERALREIPTLRMLTAAPDSLRERASVLANALGDGGVDCELVESKATVGGGSFPTAALASWAVVPGGDPQTLEPRLRLSREPVIGRVAGDRLLLDLRSVPEQDDEPLLRALLAALA